MASGVLRPLDQKCRFMSRTSSEDIFSDRENSPEPTEYPSTPSRPTTEYSSDREDSPVPTDEEFYSSSSPSSCYPSDEPDLMGFERSHGGNDDSGDDGDDEDDSEEEEDDDENDDEDGDDDKKKDIDGQGDNGSCGVLLEPLDNKEDDKDKDGDNDGGKKSDGPSRTNGGRLPKATEDKSGGRHKPSGQCYGYIEESEDDAESVGSS